MEQIKRCKNCIHLKQVAKYPQVEYQCPALNDEFTTETLWSKVQTGGCPRGCELVDEYAGDEKCE